MYDSDFSLSFNSYARNVVSVPAVTQTDPSEDRFMSAN